MVDVGEYMCLFYVIEVKALVFLMFDVSLDVVEALTMSFCALVGCNFTELLYLFYPLLDLALSFITLKLSKDLVIHLKLSPYSALLISLILLGSLGSTPLKFC